MSFSDPVPQEFITSIKAAGSGKQDIEALAAMGEQAVLLMGGEITVMDSTCTIELFRFGQGGPHGTRLGMPHVHWTSGQSPYTGHHAIKMRHSATPHLQLDELENMGLNLDVMGNPQPLPPAYFVVGSGDDQFAVPREITSLGPHYYIGKLLKALQKGWYKKMRGKPVRIRQNASGTYNVGG